MRNIPPYLRLLVDGEPRHEVLESVTVYPGIKGDSQTWKFIGAIPRLYRAQGLQPVAGEVVTDFRTHAPRIILNSFQSLGADPCYCTHLHPPEPLKSLLAAVTDQLILKRSYPWNCRTLEPTAFAVEAFPRRSRIPHPSAFPLEMRIRARLETPPDFQVRGLPRDILRRLKTALGNPNTNWHIATSTLAYLAIRNGISGIRFNGQRTLRDHGKIWFDPKDVDRMAVLIATNWRLPEGGKLYVR